MRSRRLRSCCASPSASLAPRTFCLVALTLPWRILGPCLQLLRYAECVVQRCRSPFAHIQGEVHIVCSVNQSVTWDAPAPSGDGCPDAELLMTNAQLHPVFLSLASFAESIAQQSSQSLHRINFSRLRVPQQRHPLKRPWDAPAYQPPSSYCRLRSSRNSRRMTQRTQHHQSVAVRYGNDGAPLILRLHYGQWDEKFQIGFTRVSEVVSGWYFHTH